MPRHQTIIIFLCLVFALSACNLPTSGVVETPAPGPDAIFTAAAQTVEAKLTQDALIVPATAIVVPSATNAPAVALANTDTPIPQPQATTASQTTVTPTSVCDAAQFLADVTVPDGTKYTPGTAFTKTWRLKNVGTCTWDTSYALIFDTGDAMSGPGSMPLGGTVAPGQQIDLSVTLTAPASNGTYRGYWRLRNGAGVSMPVASGYQGRSFYVEIEVKDGVAASSNEKFAVNSIVFNVSRDGSCASGKYIVTAKIIVNKAGQVTYTWIRSDGATGPSNSGALDFTEAGSKTLSFEWTTSATGLWVDLYVDNPNHQQFGRATLNCP